MEPLADARPHDDHGATLRFLGVGRHLPRHPHHLRGGHRRDRLLPRGRVGLVRVRVTGGPRAGQPVPPHAVLGEHQIEDGGDQLPGNAAHRHPAAQHAARAVERVETRQQHLHGLVAEQGQLRRDAVEIEVPATRARLGVAEAHRPVRHHRITAAPVDEHGLPRCALGVVAQVGGGEELSGHVRAIVLLERDEERQVRVALHVVDEEGHAALDEELLEHDVAHRHRHRPIRTRLRRQPRVGELRVVRVVRRDHHDLLALVSGLGHPVRVGRAGDRHVRAPHQEVGGVPPVAGLRHVGLVAEHLRGRDGQVGVPVVERGHRAADQLDEPGACGVAHHRHRGDGGEARYAVRPVGLDRVHVRGGDDLDGLVPGDAHVAALAPRRLVAEALLRVGRHLGPRCDGIAEARLGLAVHLDEHAAGVGVAHPGG